jgi:hypothetical protein
LQLDVPPDWSDASTLTFVAPAPAIEAPTVQPTAPGTVAVTVRVVRSEQTPKEALEEQRRELERMEVDYRLLDEGPFAAQVGPGWHHLQRLDLDGRGVQQLAFACRLGPFMVLASGACPEARYPHVQAQLRAVIASIDAVRS